MTYIIISADLDAGRAVPVLIRAVPPRQNTAIQTQASRRAEIALAGLAIQVAAGRVYTLLLDAELVAGHVCRVVRERLAVGGPALDFLGHCGVRHKQGGEAQSQKRRWS